MKTFFQVSKQAIANTDYHDTYHPLKDNPVALYLQSPYSNSLINQIMSQLLVKLTFGLTATVTVGFYYLAAAPPALAEVDVCGAGNFSEACDGPRPAIPAIYTNSSTPKETSIPEPSTVIAMLITGAGIIFSKRKRKNIGGEP